jgi:hypothetical protein
MKSVDLPKLIQQISDEVAHKGISKEEKSLLINSDRFLILSGQRSFYTEKSTILQREIERLNDLYKENYFKKKEYKKKFLDKEIQMVKVVGKLEKELEIYRAKVNDHFTQERMETIDSSCQTDLERTIINKMEMTYENSKIYDKGVRSLMI